MRRKTYVVPLLASVLTAALLTPAGPAGGATALGVRNIPGTPCPAFPADNYWHADISKLPVHPQSKAWIASTARGVRLHPDFGPSYGEQPVPYGIPITVVDGSHAKVAGDASSTPTRATTCSTRSAATRKIEGGRYADGDRHAIIVDKGTCRLYETWATRQTASGGAPGRARRGASSERAAPGTAGPRPTPPGCRSCRGCCASTRCRPGTSITRSASRRL